MMKLLVIAALVAVAAARSLSESSSAPDWRIVGGANAAAAQFPYIISLRQPSSHSCGGSILNTRWILTAAHCTVNASPSNLRVVAGTNTLNSGGVTLTVLLNIWHPQYNANAITYDVAVLKLATALTFSTTIQPIALNTGSTGGSVDCQLSGWGRTSTGGAIPNALQFINLRTTTVAACQSAHTLPVYDNQICTLTRTGEGACNGDSGGPLVAGGQQIGIVSWGRPCAQGYPDVYTRVSSFNSWIQTTMNANP